MKVTKWVDFGQDVEVDIDVDDIRGAINEAFSETEQRLEQAVNVHDILRAFSNIGSFLKAFSDENIARLNDSQRKIIGGFLQDAGARFLAQQPIGDRPDAPDAPNDGRVANPKGPAAQEREGSREF